MLSAHNFPKPYQKGAYFYDLTDQSSVFFTCPSCGCKLISVSSGVKAKPHCPECDYSAADAFVVKDRVMNDSAHRNQRITIAKKENKKMFNNLNLSNALALIDKPVWVITEVRGRNKNNRTYSKSRSKNVIYPATITNVQVWRGYSHSKGDTGCPKCTVTVDIATKDDTGAEIYFDLPNELLNVTVFESKEDAEKELAYLNSNKNTMTYSEQRQREDKNNAKVFGIA